jgi:hypothetical protein
MNAPYHPTRFYSDGAELSLPSRAERTSVMLTALVEQGEGHAATSHRVRDLSVGGIRIDNAARLTAGGTVSISVGALQAIGATVRWARNGFAGLAFAEPINVEEARSKAVILRARTAEPLKSLNSEVTRVPTAGWIEQIRNPYRR